MTRRRAAAFVALLLAGLAPAGAALAASRAEVRTTLTVSTPQASVGGKAVTVTAVLKDASGRPVPGALIRLETPISFVGATRNEIVAEGTTDASGRAEMRFASAQAGTIALTASYEGGPGYRAAEASLSVDVTRPVIAYHPAPPGLPEPWARSYLILLPVLAVWVTYVVALRQARRVWRLGARGRPTEEPATAPSR